MKVVVNGEERDESEGTSIQMMVTALHGTGSPAGWAVALNGEVVPRSEWNQMEVKHGDAIEIVTAIRTTSSSSRRHNLLLHSASLLTCSSSSSPTPPQCFPSASSSASPPPPLQRLLHLLTRISSSATPS